MQILVESKIVEKIDADASVVFVIDKNLDHKWITDKEILEFLGFKGESGECQFVQESKTLYVGCESLQADEMRTAAAKSYNALKKSSIKSMKIGSYGEENIKAMAEGFILGAYSFEQYKSKKTKTSLESVIISTEDHIEANIDLQYAIDAVETGKKIANATNFAKDMVNTPPYEMHSLKMAQIAESLGDLENVTCNIYGKEFLEEQGMGAFLAVNRVSHIPPRLIHIIYKPQNAKERFVFVGKGLTYDTGGLSLKPGDYMTTMKSDMSGGAAALSILKGAAELGLPFEVHAIVGATENAIGPEAYKPDDVLVAKNGKTIEVKNTDAEGRLVLADCLCYATEQDPDYLVDMATLTGACVVALGEYTTGIMGHSKALKEDLSEAAEKSGELTGILPFNKYLKKLLKSPIADMANIGSSRYGGAITAGLFLDNFVDDAYKDKWLHVDIAGPAFVEKEWGYNQAGASGAGVRMALYWMSQHA